MTRYYSNIDTADVSVLAHVMSTYHLHLVDPPSAGPAKHRQRGPAQTHSEAQQLLPQGQGQGRGQHQQGTTQMLTKLTFLS